MRPAKRILLVDGDDVRLSLRRFVLETRLYRVLAVQTAGDALEVLQQHVPDTFDLMVADLLLPGVDGIELARLAKQMRPLLPVLLTSATVVVPAVPYVAECFLGKGQASTIDVLDHIRRLAARRRGPKPAPHVIEQAKAVCA